MKINIGNYYSYKSYWYILKDLSTLDLSNLELITDKNGDDQEITEDYFWELFDDGQLGEGNITIVETNIGNFVYHRIGVNFAKKFLIENSKVAPCGFFGSYRTVDDYKIAIADNGEIKRFLSFDENGCIIEGEPTDFEDGEDAKVSDDFDEQLKFFNEDRVCRYAKWFVGFDYEEKEVEIKRVRVYANPYPIEDETQVEFVPKEYSDKLPQNAKVKVIDNLSKHKETDVAIIVAKKRGENTLVIGCKNVNINPEATIYSKLVDNYNDEIEVIKTLNKCINAISEENPKENNLNLGVTGKNIDFVFGMKNVDIVAAIVNIERKFMFQAIKIQRNGKKIKQSFFNCFINGKIYYDLNDFTIRDFYRLFIRKLK